MLRGVAAVISRLDGGYELDDDPARIDLDAVHAYLALGSYWAYGRPRETVEALVRQATRVVGLYHEGRQVGFARAVSDGVAFAYLADVYVLTEHRGRGLGVALVRAMIDGGPLSHVKWLLHTRDAHGLYRRFGFVQPSEKVLERPAPDASVEHPVGRSSRNLPTIGTDAAQNPR
jgi:GNAT superfamily N-acetyltransferase